MEKKRVTITLDTNIIDGGDSPIYNLVFNTSLKSNTREVELWRGDDIEFIIKLTNDNYTGFIGSNSVGYSGYSGCRHVLEHIKSNLNNKMEEMLIESWYGLIFSYFETALDIVYKIYSSSHTLHASLSIHYRMFQGKMESTPRFCVRNNKGSKRVQNINPNNIRMYLINSFLKGHCVTNSFGCYESNTKNITTITTVPLDGRYIPFLKSVSLYLKRRYNINLKIVEGMYKYVIACDDNLTLDRFEDFLYTYSYKYGCSLERWYGIKGGMMINEYNIWKVTK